jgi:hypothetical protein
MIIAPPIFDAVQPALAAGAHPEDHRHHHEQVHPELVVNGARVELCGVAVIDQRRIDGSKHRHTDAHRDSHLEEMEQATTSGSGCSGPRTTRRRTPTAAGCSSAIIEHRMTTKDDRHALIDALDELDARDALEFVKARLELEPNVSQSYIAECEAALDEAHAPDAVLIPHEAVRTWLQAWGTPDEAAADREIEQFEQQLVDEGRNRATE